MLVHRIDLACIDTELPGGTSVTGAAIAKARSRGADAGPPIRLQLLLGRGRNE